MLAKSGPSTNNQWILQHPSDSKHHQHNHPPNISPAAHPVHRKQIRAIMASIESASRRIGIRARNVRSVVQHQHPDATITARDIYNARNAITRKKMDSYISTAALIKKFDNQSIPYIAKWDTNEPTRLIGFI
jgi:hypothetical protein